MQKATCLILTFLCFTLTASGQNAVSAGKRLFDTETFGGNGRTCQTCHSKTTGTVSPADVQLLFKSRPKDPLFMADGSDDGNGHGTTRIQTHATILMHIPLANNVQLASDPSAKQVTVSRGIPTTINTPGIEVRRAALSQPVTIMLDGRQPNLQSQALGAIQDHAQATLSPTAADLEAIKDFQLTNEFFSSPEVRNFAQGGAAPALPAGNTASEKRGRLFFEDVVDFVDPKHGLCAGCHAGPMLDETNLFSLIAFKIPVGTRFQNILISELNVMGNPEQTFVFNKGQDNERVLSSSDPGRSLITGVTDEEDFTFSNWNAFKIPQLRGIRDTGPYFHDNSAKTLEDVAAHYALFFAIVTDFDGPDGPLPPLIVLTPQDQADMVAFMKLLR